MPPNGTPSRPKPLFPNPARQPPPYPQCNQLNLQLKLNKWLRLPKNHNSPRPSRAAPAAIGTPKTAPSIPSCIPPNPARRQASGPSNLFYPQCNQLNLQPKLNKWVRLPKSHKSLRPNPAAPAAIGTPTTAPSIPSCIPPNSARRPASGPSNQFYPQCKHMNLQQKLNKWFRLAKDSKSRRPPHASHATPPPVPPIT